MLNRFLPVQSIPRVFFGLDLAQNNNETATKLANTGLGAVVPKRAKICSLRES